MSQRRFILSPTTDMGRAGSYTSEVSPAQSAAARAQHCTTAPAPRGMHVYLRADRTRAGPLCIHGVRPLERVSGRAHRAVDAVPIMPQIARQMRTNVSARRVHTPTDGTLSFVDSCAPCALFTGAPHAVGTSSTLSVDVLPTTPAAATDHSGARSSVASALRIHHA